MSRLFAGIVAGTLAFGAGSAPADQAPSAELEIPLQHWSAPLLFRPGASAAPYKAKGSGREVDIILSLPTDPMSFVAIEPCRLVDTRGLSLPNPPYPLPAGYGSDNPLVAGSTADYQVTGATQCSIPAGARAISANITLVNYTTDGYLTAYPQDLSRPLVATMNWRTAVPPAVGQFSQNAGIVELSVGGSVRVFALQFAKMIVDVNGYYAPVATFSPVSAVVATQESTSSSTWGDLATVGPVVTVTVPASGRVLLTLSALMKFLNPSLAELASMGFDATGPTPLSPSDLQSLSLSPGLLHQQVSWTRLITDLTPGSYTFTAKYKAIVSSGVASFVDRQIIVIPVP